MGMFLGEGRPLWCLLTPPLSALNTLIPNYTPLFLKKKYFFYSLPFAPDAVNSLNFFTTTMSSVED